MTAPSSDTIVALADRLSRLDRPGDFCAAGMLTCPMPALHVDGVGPIALPVLRFQAEQLIAAAEPAPYGRGPDTLVDPSVRKASQVAVERFHIRDGTWPHTLDAIVLDVARQLGASGVRAELYKLLIYEDGGFFVPHRDTEKVDGMFATLVVCLPSMHEGGALVVRHQGREHTVDLANDDVTRVTYAAFYADCVHEVRPITSGHRVVLVYNLVRDAGWLAAPDHREAVADVAAILRSWDPSEGPVKALCVLEHHYTPAGLSFAGLKNGDAAMAEVVVPAARESGCVVHLAMVSIQETGSAEPVYQSRSRRWRGTKSDDEGEYEIVEVLERVERVEGWRTTDDQPASLVPIPWTEDEVCPEGALDDIAPDEDYFTEATGNEGGSFERTYRRAALVLWPERHRLALAAQAGVGFAVPMLDTLPDDEARALATMVVDGWPDDLARPRNGGALRGQLLAALARLGEARLAERCFDVVVLEKGFDGAEVDGIVACWQTLDRATMGPRVAAIFDEHMEEQTAGCAALLDRLLALPDGDARTIAERAVLRLPRAPAPRPWDAVVEPEIVASLIASLARLGDTDLVQRAVDHVLAEPVRYPLDEVVVPAAIRLTDVPLARGLRDRARAHLDGRIALPLEPPSDWSRSDPLRCSCASCRDLASFLADPARDTWSTRLAERGRKHLEAEARQADLAFETIRQGSPHTLVATKTQRSYDRRVAQRRQDLDLRAKLAG